MRRLEDTPDLFGYGMGVSTCGKQECGWCGHVYNKGCDEECEGGEFVTWTDFGSLEVCECCFGKIEQAVLNRMPDILPWYRRFMDKQTKEIQAMNSELEETENKQDESK